jgi:uncharacterized paraquat-inducible protein A
MGHAKEQMIVREERSREHAPACACGAGEPLLTAKERSTGLCARCEHNLSKDERNSN